MARSQGQWQASSVQKDACFLESPGRVQNVPHALMTCNTLFYDHISKVKYNYLFIVSFPHWVVNS